MLPKVESAISFASSKAGRRAVCFLFGKGTCHFRGKSGTVILCNSTIFNHYFNRRNFMKSELRHFIDTNDFAKKN